MIEILTLAYRVKLDATRIKSDMLGMLCDYFAREQHEALDFLDGIVAQEGRLVLKGKSQVGEGEFKQRVRYRAFNDYKRARKAAKALKKQMKLPYLHAELCDAAEVQEPRNATHFPLWVHVEGLARDCQLYLPTRKHKALNRALEHPGATLGKAAQVMRRKGKWYAIVYVRCPLPETYGPHGSLGCDVGVRKSVTRSDGYQGPSIDRKIEQRADRQHRGVRHKTSRSYQRQQLDKEARRAVLVALSCGQSLSVEDPARLPKWRGWAARHFAKCVVLLASLYGVPIRYIAPPYTSLTCSRCGAVSKLNRRGTWFRCIKCGFTHNADVNAARNIAVWPVCTDTPHKSPKSLLLWPVAKS